MFERSQRGGEGDVQRGYRDAGGGNDLYHVVGSGQRVRQQRIQSVRAVGEGVGDADGS